MMNSGVRLFEKEQGFEVKWVRELAGIGAGAKKQAQSVVVKDMWQ